MKKNQIYIGSSTNLIKRFKEHLKGEKSNILLIRSIKKYGLSTFNFIIFEFYLDGKDFHHHLTPRLEGNQKEESILSITDLETLYFKSFKTDLLFNFKLEAGPEGRLS